MCAFNSAFLCWVNNAVCLRCSFVFGRAVFGVFQVLCKYSSHFSASEVVEFSVCLIALFKSIQLRLTELLRSYKLEITILNLRSFAQVEDKQFVWTVSDRTFVEIPREYAISVFAPWFVLFTRLFTIIFCNLFFVFSRRTSIYYQYVIPCIPIVGYQP